MSQPRVLFRHAQFAAAAVYEVMAPGTAPRGQFIGRLDAGSAVAGEPVVRKDYGSIRIPAAIAAVKSDHAGLAACFGSQVHAATSIGNSRCTPRLRKSSRTSSRYSVSCAVVITDVTGRIRMALSFVS